MFLAPFETTYLISAVDPRTYLAAALALRAAYDQLVHGARVPARVELVWCLFLVTTATVIRVRGAELDPGDLERAQEVFRYMLAASFSAYAVLQLCNDARARRCLAFAFSASVVWVIVFSIFQRVYDGEAVRLTGPFGNPNYLAGFLGLSATVILTLLGHGLLPRWYAYVVVALALITCALTLSRVGMLAAVLGVILHRACTAPKARRLRRIVVSLALVAVVSFVFASYLTHARAQFESSPVSARQAKVAQLGQAVSDLGRLEAALFAVRVFRENPVFGVGLATLDARNYDQNGILVATHDTYLELLAGTGILGALLLTTVVFQLARNIPKEYRVYLFPLAACFMVNAGSGGQYLYSISTFVLLAVGYLTVLPLCDTPSGAAAKRAACLQAPGSAQ